MKKYRVSFFLLFVFPFLLTLLVFGGGDLLACPNCAGLSVTEKNNNTVIILGTFIALTYIPFYVIFRIMKKYK